MTGGLGGQALLPQAFFRHDAKLAASAVPRYSVLMAGHTTRVAVIAGAVIVLGAGAALLVRRPKPPVAPPPAVAAKTATAAAKPLPPANCLLPGPSPVPPDGLTFSAADMKLQREAIQHFVEELEAYQACRDAQADLSGPGVAKRQKDIWIQQGDDAIDEANALKDAFSEQLKIFDSRPGNPP
jgi:hypothetical protein